MPARYDAKLGKVVFEEDELGNPVTDPAVLNPEDVQGEQFKVGAVENPLFEMAADKAETDELAVQQQALGKGLNDDRPFISGSTLLDIPKAALDVGSGLVTDLVDLGSGLVDVARATASSAGLGEFGWDQVFDDRDNPLTQFRRNTVGNYDTKLGEMIGTTGRIASFFVGGKWLYRAPKLASKINQLGKIVGLVPGAYRSTATAQRLATGAAAANKAAKGTKVFKIASKNPYLTTTFKDIANAPEVAGWWKSSVNSFRAIKGMGKAKINPRNLAETLAMDLFASFNVFGEGNDGMDETIFDMFDDVGLEVPEALLQSPLDSGVSRKLKGMLDGTLFSFVGGGVIDLWRIGKFRRAFDAASEVDKKEIRKAFLDSYEELGNGVGSMLSRLNANQERLIGELGPGAASQLDPFGRQPLNDGREAFYGSKPFSGAYDPFDTPGQLARLDDVRAKNDRFELAETQAMVNARSAIEEVNVRTQAIPEQPQLLDAPGSARIRVEEPTVSPGGIADAVERSMANGVPPEQIVRDVQRLMPRKNVDLIDYMKMNPPRLNSAGMIRASDQIWSDYILKKGLSEGWVRLDDDFNAVFVRSAAYEADAAELIEQQAKALDELQQIRDFEMFADSRPKGDAADLDARLKERQPENYPASETMPVRDPAALAAEADAINAAKNEDALADEEFARLAKNVVADDPDQLIRDQLRVDPLQADESVTVAKSETGRGWEVYDENGELYQNGRFTTKRAAEKFAAKERKALKDDLAKRAQQVVDDDAGELIEYGTMEFARDGDLLGDVKITGPQLKALQELGIEGLPEKAGKATFTQAQMSDIVSRAMEAGATGNKGRVLNRIVENFDVAVRELEPQVRIQRQSQKLIEQTKRVLNHGDYCA